MNSKIDFIVSKNSVFKTSWYSGSFCAEDFNRAHKDIIFVIPAYQPDTQRYLEKHFPAITIFSLIDEENIQTCINYIKSFSPHVIFTSQSPWDMGINFNAYSSFLMFIQRLGMLPQTIDIDIVTHSALPNPFKKHIIHPIDAVYVGLGQTIQKELPNLRMRVFDLESIDASSIDKIRRYHFTVKNDSPIHIVGNEYHVNYLSPLQFDHSSHVGFKKNGIYLIIGGTGGIGSALAEYLIKKYDATLILVGRKPPNHDLQTKFKNASVHFEVADITSDVEVDALFSRYNKIDGIIHSALVLDDSSILNMASSQLNDVIAPKVKGTFNLINAIRHRKFDFVLFFSSIQSYIANAGQSNYTAACVAKDALAFLLHDAFMANVKIINWGYWGSVGVVAKDFYRQRMNELQIQSIEVDEGMQIIENLLQSDTRQITVIKASSEALSRLNIIENEMVMSESLYPLLLKPYNTSDQVVIRNKTSMELLDRYAKSLVKAISLPNTVLPRFEKLSQAIRAIQSVDPIDRNVLLRDYPEIKAHIALLEKCVSHLPQILVGETDPLSILFPNGSFELVEPIYRNNPIADYFNSQVSEAVVQFIKYKMNKSTTLIRVLEIGAGTGSTSQFVIPAIANFPVKYHYTDVSRAFLIKANRIYNEFPFIEYEIFNVEESYKHNNYFDIVIATNVIHATHDIHQVLSNVYDLIKPDGIFVLNEITERQDFATLTFGLTDGWWLSNDKYRVPNSPLINIQSWVQLLKSSKFEHIDIHGGDGQHVVVSYTGNKTGEKNPQPFSPIEVNKSILSAPSVKSSVNTWLKELIASVMMMSQDELEDDVPFNEYGIDSLISLELISPMNKKLGYVPATILFEYPTIKQLSDYLCKEFSDHFSEKTDLSITIEKELTHNNKNLITDKIKSIIAKVIESHPNELNDNVPLSEYGIDSLISLEILTPMREEFGYLPATLLFEYPTIDALTQYFAGLNGVSTTTVYNSDVQQNKTNVAPEADIQDDIVIIGVSGQFPQAQNYDELWTILKEGKTTFSEVPSERWAEAMSDKVYTRIGSFVDDIDAFDHSFFNITPIEAERMDPQERLFLQTSYHAIQDAGIQVETLSGQDVGCYVGVMNHGYSYLTLNDINQGSPSSLFWSIANRASYIFNWKGPSFAVDSACSSSLTALHTAIMGLKNKDCDVAVVGGVNLIVHPRQYEDLCQLHMLSPKGSCKPFSAESDGIVDGEGIICIILKRYQDALRDNNYIYGVIRGSSINSGGKANGYTAPNPDAQALLIHKALSRANLKPQDIGYIEAHGTGTELGDPIEVRGLSKIFDNHSIQSIPIGSIKGNLGHLESAAGLASVVKVLLQFKHNMLAPSIGCTKENPHLNINKQTMHVNTILREWPAELPKRACVSSFGAGGANAHVIIEAYNNTESLNQEEKCYIIPLSAHSKTALQNEINSLYEYLIKNDVMLDHICYGYSRVRSTHAFRTGFIARDKINLISQLELSHHLIRQNDSPNIQIDIENEINKFIATKQQDSIAAKKILQAFTQGQHVPFERLFTRKIFPKLPNYTFDKHRHWVNAKETQFQLVENIIRQHNIRGKCMAPASYAFSRLIEENSGSVFESIIWKNMITDLNTIDLVLEGDKFKIKDKYSNTIFCEGSIKSHQLTPHKVKMEESKNGEYFSNKEIYHYFESIGYFYKGHFKSIKWAIVNEDKIYSQIEVNQDWEFKLSPAIIDAALQTAILSRKNEIVNDKTIMVPYYLERICIYKIPVNTIIFCTCSINNENSEKVSNYDIELSDDEGNVLISLHGVMSIQASFDALLSKSKNETITTKVLEYELN